MTVHRSHVVGAGRGITAVSGPVRVEELTPGFIDALVGMRSEIVALCLQEIGGEAAAAVAVEVVQCRRHGRQWDAEVDGGADDVAPVVLCG